MLIPISTPLHEKEEHNKQKDWIPSKLSKCNSLHALKAFVGFIELFKNEEHLFCQKVWLGSTLWHNIIIINNSSLKDGII